MCIGLSVLCKDLWPCIALTLHCSDPALLWPCIVLTLHCSHPVFFWYFIVLPLYCSDSVLFYLTLYCSDPVLLSPCIVLPLYCSDTLLLWPCIALTLYCYSVHYDSGFESTHNSAITRSPRYRSAAWPSSLISQKFATMCKCSVLMVIPKVVK